MHSPPPPPSRYFSGGVVGLCNVAERSPTKAPDTTVMRSGAAVPKWYSGCSAVLLITPGPECHATFKVVVINRCGTRLARLDSQSDGGF